MIKPQVTWTALAVAAALSMLATPKARPADEQPADAPDTVAEVTVTARRELEKQASQFVNQIAAGENEAEGLARWQVPAACPLVSGLPEKDGEFILERLSEIAHTAGVPLAGEHCSPNLYVLVSDQPAELLRGMEKRNRAFTFGFDNSFYPPAATPATVVDAFITTPRAVRVWYNTDQKDDWGKPLSYCPSSEVFPGCTGRSAACDPTRYYLCTKGVAGGSHLVTNATWTFSRVFVIVDSAKLKGVELGQLADYVAMSGFAKLKPGARLEAAPTILKLFDAGSEAAPAGLTQWDQTFLKSLYETNETSKLQRSAIARSMVREMAP